MEKFLILIVLCMITAPCFAQDGAELTDADKIMEKSENTKRLQAMTSKAVLITGGEGVEKREKTFTWWRKLSKDGVRFSTLTRFHTPAEIRGQGILFIEHENGLNDVLLYLPTFKKVRRIESESQSSSFMGSSFSYSDMAPPHYTDFKNKLLGKEACPKNTERSCYVIESIPRNDGVRTRSGYSRNIQWIDSTHFLGVHGEFFGLDGKLLKTMSAWDIREVDTKNHKWLAHQVREDEVRTKRYTELKFGKVEVLDALPDSIFSRQNLMRD